MGGGVGSDWFGLVRIGSDQQSNILTVQHARLRSDCQTCFPEGVGGFVPTHPERRDDGNRPASGIPRGPNVDPGGGRRVPNPHSTSDPVQSPP